MQTPGIDNGVIQKERPMQAVFLAPTPNTVKFKSLPSLSADLSRIKHFNISIVRMKHTIRFCPNNGKLCTLNKYF